MRHKRWLPTFGVLMLLCVTSCSRQTAATGDGVKLHPLFTSDNPESIYAADPNDSWNRIFRALFTRTVKARLSSDFPEGAPLVSFTEAMGVSPLRISRATFDRKEIGDRGIEPLYPTFLTVDGPLQVLSEPRFSELTTALSEAIAETRSRSTVERALMQSDVWAAYDIIYATRRGNTERKERLLSLLSQFLRKLSLTSEQINSLHSNYQLAVAAKKLPNIFAPESGWLEIELLPRRSHDDAADYRRAARVFLKPRSTPSDPGAFVEKLKHNQHLDEVDSVALVVQNLLINTSGRAVPSPLINDVQFRIFTNDPKKGAITAEISQFELSRRKLLTEPRTGGFVTINPTDPTYLTSAGNDYGFASSIFGADAPIVVPLRTRCSQCHGKSLVTLMTYSIHYFPPVPTVKVLNPAKQERILYVANRKEQRDDFKSLFGVR